MNTSKKIGSQDSRVVIIGGGPGGSACALALQRKATQLGVSLHITLIEGKQFLDEKHYNQCVGVLSPPLPALLETDLGIPFPMHLCQVDIQGYVLHSSSEQIKLEGEDGDSYALRRVQFDQYMLEKVQEKGIAVFPGRAVDLEFHADRVIIYTESLPLEADVVVGAFGLDEGSASMFSRHTPYRPPQAIDALVTKWHPDPEDGSNLQGYIHAFLLSNPRIEFGAVTPKCTHCTINIAGDSIDTPLMDKFINHPSVRSVLPEIDRDHPNGANDLVYFKGRFPRSLARNYYGDRYVMVGDAAGLVRAFKGKGVTTAVLTGIRAAETILNHGYSREAFHQYYRTANHDIIQDLPYGRAMRVLTIFMSRVGLINPVLRAAHHTPDLQSALFDAVSAHALYRDVFAKSLRPKTVFAILKAMLPGSNSN
ncbi:MAG TPA: NAD(P)/FAD-dependent oxidoreductase [Anaerolineales bacterium]|nr:NAD(P)/FAD-dependent oxidoreductase [Anaerolineales bacterium]